MNKTVMSDKIIAYFASKVVKAIAFCETRLNAALNGTKDDDLSRWI